MHTNIITVHVLAVCAQLIVLQGKKSKFQKSLEGLHAQNICPVVSPRESKSLHRLARFLHPTCLLTITASTKLCP